MHLASYKSDFYKKTEGISPRIKAGVDHDLYFKIEEVGDIFVLNEFTYNYYQRNESAITKDEVRLRYWNMEVRKETCLRRGLDVDSIICNDWTYIFERMKDNARHEKEEEIRSSHAYRLGKFLLKPLSMMKRLFR